MKDVRTFLRPVTLERLAPRLLLLILAGMFPVQAAEFDALLISNSIQSQHMPHETILSPVFAARDSNQVVSYTRGGDSAIWTGHYLAAEAFRYGVTRSPEALENLRRALNGIRLLVDVTGRNLLARCLIPINSRFAADITEEERRHRIYTSTLGNTTYYWVGNTSRDQYSGVFFGLGVAFDMMEDSQLELRAPIADLVTRLLEYLLQNNWAVVMPNGTISTVFWLSPEQQLSFLQVGRRVNPARFDSIYRSYRAAYSASVLRSVSFDVLDDHNSYFKFNLHTINLYNLIRLEDNSYYRWWYVNAYDVMRRTTDDHGNAHFNMIDRGLKGPNSKRDAETRTLLQEWLRRPRRDQWVDLRGVYRACGPDRACDPIPVAQRVSTDFLWQRSPFLLYGGGAGYIEEPGIDYILPYWMARFFGVL